MDAGHSAAGFFPDPDRQFDLLHNPDHVFRLRTQLKPWFVYILHCRDDTLYTGITTDVGRRIEEHNAGKAPGARYTRSRRPVKLAYAEEAASRAAAARRETAIKQFDRNGKLVLCASWQGRELGD